VCVGFKATFIGRQIKVFIQFSFFLETSLLESTDRFLVDCRPRISTLELEKTFETQLIRQLLSNG